MVVKALPGLPIRIRLKVEKYVQTLSRLASIDYEVLRPVIKALIGSMVRAKIGPSTARNST